MEIKFIESDVTCSGYHFASVNDIKETTKEENSLIKTDKSIEKIKTIFKGLSKEN